jgi:hypothetical protein
MENYYFVIKYTAGNSEVRTKTVEAYDPCPSYEIARLKAYYGEQNPINVLSISLEKM